MMQDSRIALYNENIPPDRMGRIVQRIVELETYRMLALLGFATVRENGAKLWQDRTHCRWADNRSGGAGGGP